MPSDAGRASNGLELQRDRLPEEGAAEGGRGSQKGCFTPRAIGRESDKKGTGSLASPLRRPPGSIDP